MKKIFLGLALINSSSDKEERSQNTDSDKTKPMFMNSKLETAKK